VAAVDSESSNLCLLSHIVLGAPPGLQASDCRDWWAAVLAREGSALSAMWDLRVCLKIAGFASELPCAFFAACEFLS